MGGLTASAIAVVLLHELGCKQSIRQLLPRFTQAKYLRCLVESICQDRPDRIFQCGPRWSSRIFRRRMGS
jgi:hypothetical protein